MMVARHEVPGKAAEYAITRCQFILLSDTGFEISSFDLRIGTHTCTNHTVPYGKVLLGCAVPGTS